MSSLTVTPFDASRVLENQPWLTAEENEQFEVLAADLDKKIGAEDLPSHLLRHFILTTHYEIVEEPNFLRWGAFMERATHRIIAVTELCGGAGNGPSHRPGSISVSTVFSGGDEHTLFETMVFGGWFNTIHWRSWTVIGAKMCHWSTVAMLRRHNNFMRRNYKRVRKDWKRLKRFWEMVHERGAGWCEKHKMTMAPVFLRLCAIPGRPPVPMPDPLFDFFQTITPRPVESLNET